MVAGFLGTLIGLERAVALGQRWPYIGPVLTAAGTLGLLAGIPGALGKTLITLGSLGLGAALTQVIRRQRTPATWTLELGALLWAVGNGLWSLGTPLFRVVPWWAGFLILTIAGERLELGRLLRPGPWVSRSFQLLLALLVGGLLFANPRILGGATVGLSLWLLRYDTVRHTLRIPGLMRFTSLSLLLGHLWLGIGGLLMVWNGGLQAGPLYDAIWHSLFVGFVFSMIFGHAPLILPAILGFPIPFHPTLYLHLTLLHGSLVLRITGDLLPWIPGRQWGGLLNALAILLFLLQTARGILSHRSR